jgi:hypothetical protein
MSLKNAGGGIMVTGSTSLQHTTVGILLAGKATMQEGARVLLTTPQAAALGAAFGLVAALINAWLRRR